MFLRFHKQLNGIPYSYTLQQLWLCCLLVLLILHACSSHKILSDTQHTITIKKSLYKTLKPWLGVPYKTGGQDFRGVDCSGFTCAVYRDQFQYSLPRTVKEQWSVCKQVDRRKLKEGDLVFFAPGKSGVSHVGIYLKDEVFIHASVSKGVVLSKLSATYYRNAWYGAGRVK